MSKFNKSFKSELDEFLEAFDKEHPMRSQSQEKVIKKYQRIDLLRDVPSVQKAHDVASLDLFE